MVRKTTRLTTNRKSSLPTRTTRAKQDKESKKRNVLTGNVKSNNDPNPSSRTTKNYAKKMTKDDTDQPLWKNVNGNTILCGQISLHAKNVGNILFRDYVHAAAVHHFQHRGSQRYTRMSVVDEIRNKFKSYQWHKKDDNYKKLTNAEIDTKIKKAINDKITKFSRQLDKKFSGSYQTKLIKWRQPTRRH